MKTAKLLSFLMAALLVLPLLPMGILPAAATDTVKGAYTYGGIEYTLYTGFNATIGASGVNSNEGYDKLVDGSLTTKYCRTSSGAYVEFNATSDGFAPVGYIFTTGNDNEASPGRNPKNWTIQAKAASGDAWTTLVSVENDTVLQDVNFTDYAFAIDYSGENAAKFAKYKFFRIDFTAYQSGTVFQLSEVRFFGLDDPVVEITARAATCTAIGYSRNCYFCIDSYYADEACTQPLAASSVEIPMIAHTLVHHAAVAHTATTNGNIEYWQCSACGKYFADANAATEISEIDTIDWAPCAYIDENGASATYTGSTNTVSASDTAWTDGWYVVRENTTVDSRVTVTGTVNLVLLNGTTLTIDKGVNVPFNSSSPNTFNIYAQSADADTMGALTIQNVDSNNAAIGGNNSQNYGNINIYGGKLTLKSGSNGAAIGTGNNGGTGYTGTILIAGGIVSVPVSNGYGAGIGGGEYSYGGNIVITGGTVDVKGGAHSAGIGGCDGYRGGNITISGGTITARASDKSAAIGGGDYWSSSANQGGRAGNITITGGKITTTCGTGGFGIGDSYSPNTYGSSSVTISLPVGDWIDTQSIKAETVTFNGNHSIERNGVLSFADVYEAAQGGVIARDTRTAYTVTFVDSDGTTVISTLTAFSGDATPASRVEPIKAGYVFDKWTKNGTAYDFSTPVTGNITLKASYTASPALTYLNENGAAVTTSSYFTIGALTDMSALPAGIYMVGGDLTSDTRIVFAGNASLVLKNGTTLTANNGIEVKPGASLAIFGQSVGENETEGKLVTKTKETNYPAIGYHEAPQEGDKIAIYGGNIDARASYNYGAGIGGGNNISATVLIGGGSVMAYGGYDGAGIGGGNSAVGNVTITGGVVYGCGGNYAAGIGGGYNAVGNVTISGGVVSATSGYYGAAGIGCGYSKDGGSVTITGGHVTVNNRSDTYGIGGKTAGGSTAISLGVVSNSDFIVSPVYNGTVTFNHVLRLRNAEEMTIATAENIAGQILISADIENVTVTFVDEDGAVLSTVSVVPGDSAAAPSAPDKSALFKSFVGWYVGTAPFDATVPVFENITVTAVYAEIPMPQGEGTSSAPYRIASADDWNNVADAVNTFGFTFEGKYLVLVNSITVTTKIGNKNDNKYFSGNFNGNGKTITLDLAADGKQGSAPFSYVKGATLRNIKTAGVVHANAYHASGLVGFADGVTIRNCRVNASILFTRNMATVHSGSFIGHALSAPFTMNGCVFAGVIGYETEGSGSASGLTNVGGLVGWDDDSTPTITNCLNAGTFSSNPTKIAPIARVNGRGTVTNCYTTVSGISCQGSNNDNRGAFVRTIFAGPFVSLDLADKTNYGTAGVAAASVGMIYNGKIYAADGETIVLAATYTGSETDVDLQYTTTAGNLVQSGSTLTLSVSGDATISVRTGVFYNVTVADGIETGSISIDKGVSEAGDTVTITVDFGGNNDLSSLTVTNGTTSAALTKTSETTWTFVMPENDVTVNASFVAALTNGSGTAADPYLIANIHDWNVFARLVNTGSTGLCAKQTAGISGITNTVGTNDKRYNGVFDGNGYTLTVNLTASGEGSGPFAYVSGAKIQRVHTAGTIVTGYKYAGGVIGHSYGTTQVLSSVSSVYINSSIAGDGTHGGIAGVAEGTLTINNCLFNGRIGSSSTYACGGLVGWRSGTLYVKNSLVAPEAIYLNQTDCATIARNGGSFENCYYKTQIGTEQGTAVGEMTEAELVSALGKGWTLKNGKAWPAKNEKNVQTATVTVFDRVYTGEVLDPPVTVTDFLGNVLTVGTDYTLTVSPETVKAIGTYTVTITGAGNYTGSTTATFKVQLRDPQLLEDGENLYINMIVNKTITIDLRNETKGFTFKIYDDGGASSFYSHSQSSYVIVEAPAGMILKISGSGVTENGYDYVRLFDSDLSKQIGINKYTNTFVMSPIASSDNKIKILFYSDGSGSYSGFALDVELIGPEDAGELSFVYGDQSNTMKAVIGENFILPEFTTFYTLYETDLFGGWDLNGTAYQPGDTITVAENMTFTAIVTQRPVLIEDGNGGYYALILNGNTQLDLTGKSDGFTFKVYDRGGKNNYYTNYNDGTLAITIPEGYTLKISGSGSTESGWDFLYIRNANGELLGFNYDSNNKKGYCGSFTVDELTAEGSMIIAFYSDSTNTGTGFELTVTLVKTTVTHDLNNDGNVDILDVSKLLDVLSGGTAEANCDLNDDGVVDILDVSKLLDVLSGN